MKNKILFILLSIIILCGVIFIIIDQNTLPQYNLFDDNQVNITYFDINREIYNDYPFCKDRTIFAYTQTEDEAFISIDIQASNRDMAKFDKTRESEIKSYLYNLVVSIENPYKRPIMLILSNKHLHTEETIIYTAHFNWDNKYDYLVCTSLEREVEWDRPLK